MNKTLTIELVPRGQWGTNLRSSLSKEDWDKLRRECYRLANYKCEICEGIGPNHPVECHEIWNYDDDIHIQRLDGLIALCPNCHSVKHMGRSMAVGNGPKALEHLHIVRGWTSEMAIDYVDDAKAIWKRRSKFEWELDLSWLETKGVIIPERTEEDEDS